MIKIGDRISDRYRILSRLGTGGMAEVYEASDFVSKKTVAIKIIKEELCDDPKQIEQFNNEATFCAIMDHPNIVKVYSRGEVDGRPYLAYEFVKGNTLDEKLDYLTQFSLREACTIMLQLCDAINYIHCAGVIHRDIKPQNIFYLSNGVVKVGDFGISTELSTAQKDQKGVTGSIYYLAPELAQGRAPTIQSDIYAMGITFFELLTGRVPFEGSDAKEIALSHIKKPLPSVREHNPDLNKNVDYVLSKACNKKPNLRYKDVLELKKDIQALLDNKENFIEKRNFIKKIFGLK